ncbi:phosphoinositide phosphatase SAC8 isoform X2 [Micractinium conductrix]|uniref:Phosphoinositide phosphatase SAC8 isoform X2 n=1 Tax=Micractinium conductrix TaxID=554055 RepID=A0A2P6VH91_9CHLO|nr:phosphoinositide phosphatase SAC8 isoform X2 [Micractinium conductrix]|eukprot:PSC73450.1 phosphoinositide phosphatase SAC8 isoform X2 [Micractinium conductrix]
MAYSKTTPGQIAAQLAVGAAALGLFYNSFYRKPEAKPSLAGEPTPAASSAAGASAAATLVALDAEAANTAGKVWAAKQKQADAESEAPGTPSLALYPSMRLQRLGSIAVVQPVWGGEVAGPSLTCDLETGTLALAEHPKVDKGFSEVFGVLGLARLEAGPALVVITGLEEVATLRGHPLFRVTKTEVLADTRNGKWKSTDHSFLKLLKSGTDPSRYGGSLYLSHGGDATLTQQRYEASQGGVPWQRAALSFTWNRNLAAPLLEAGMARFVPPVFQGFAGEIKELSLPGSGSRGHDVRVTLIARRSLRRAGCRQWRRGADLVAAVANFVESEQLTVIDGGAVQASFVQIRGSIPLLWSQTPCLKYKIPIRLAPPARSDAVFAEHARHLIDGYREVVGINLANQGGREGRLSAAYADAARAFAASGPGPAAFRLEPFDFHKQCGAANYARLAVLWEGIEREFKRFGYWFRDNAGTAAAQAGVFRTNCIDCLDRTNVVQGMLGKKQLEHLLQRLGLMREGASLPQALPEIDVAFRVMWADHGDEVSMQYAGTGAMKSAFTRTGKRDIWGLLDDGAKSLTRYYLNNFADGHKQDAIDLVTGSYTVVPGKRAPFHRQGSPAVPLLAVAALLLLAWFNLRGLAAAGGLLGAAPTALAQQVAAPLALAATLLFVVMRAGQQLVDRPQLRPDAAAPWH